MKAKLLAAFLTLGVSQASIATMNYNGWAVGVDGGWSNASNKMQNNSQPNLGKTMTFNSAIMGAHADFHKSAPNNLYMGLGFGAGYYAGTPSQSAGNHTTGVYSGANINVKQKRKLYGEVAARFGMNYTNYIAYALVAARCTRIEYKTSSDNNNKYPGYTTKKNIWGVAPGAGFDIKVAKNWSLGAEYRYFFEQDAGFNNGKYKNQNAHNVIGRVSYHF